MTKEQAQPVIIVESGPEFAAPKAIPHWAIVAQHVQGHAADHGQIFRRVVAPCPAGIFAKLHVQDPMLLIFDAPMTADDGGKSVTLYQRAQEVAVFRTDAFPMSRVDSTRPTAWSPAQSGLASSQSIE